MPIAAAYISEIARADRRGPFFLFYEAIFPVGLATVALAGAYIVPRFGWQWLFVIGGIPSIVLGDAIPMSRIAALACRQGPHG